MTQVELEFERDKFPHLPPHIFLLGLGVPMRTEAVLKKIKSMGLTPAAQDITDAFESEFSDLWDVIPVAILDPREEKKWDPHAHFLVAVE